jgi:hypothetical protein
VRRAADRQVTGWVAGRVAALAAYLPDGSATITGFPDPDLFPVFELPAVAPL